MAVEDLIGQLCIAAGMIMEDASVSAISTGVIMHRRVAELIDASDKIGVLAAVADALSQYPPDD